MAQATRPAARLTVLSGSSGVARHRVAGIVRARLPVRWRPVPVTTRPRRHGEVDGADYRFVDRAAFDTLIDNGLMLEWAELGGHRYGTPRSAIDARLRQGEPVLLSIDLPGARQVRRSMPEARLVLLVLPGQEAPPVEPEADVTLVNDSVGRAAEELVGLLGSPALL